MKVSIDTIGFTPPNALEPSGQAEEKGGWQSQAACSDLDGDLFFPERGKRSDSAKKVCQQCSVADECLEEALGADLHGVWGGTTKLERNQMRRTRLAEAALASELK